MIKPLTMILAAVFLLISASAGKADFASSAASEAAPLPAAPPNQTTPAPPQAVSAELRGLDKTTARVSTFEAPVGQIVHFGTLDITVKDCRKRPPEDEPEVAAYLEIEETRPGEAKPVAQFQGWMFASSPAISALEHPVYDVWVLDCKMSSGSSTKSG